MSGNTGVVAQGDLNSQVVAVSGLDPVACANGATAGVVIDRQGYNACKVVVQAGVKSGGALTSITMGMVHGTTNAPATNVASTDSKIPSGAYNNSIVITTESSITSAALDLRGLGRYIKISPTVVISGGANIPIGITVLFADESI